jgi:hypothetical protein
VDLPLGRQRAREGEATFHPGCERLGLLERLVGDAYEFVTVSELLANG